jgi:hypothetical protein
MPQTPPVDQRRWILIKKPLPRKKALASRRKEIRDIRAELEARNKELRHFLLLPLRKFTDELVPVLPGDSRYEKAEMLYDPTSLTGRWNFVTNLPL